MSMNAVFAKRSSRYLKERAMMEANYGALNARQINPIGSYPFLALPLANRLQQPVVPQDPPEQFNSKG